MDQLINIDKGQSIFIEGREHEFCNFVPNETGGASAPDDLQFADKRNGRFRVYSRSEFDDLYTAKKVRWKLSIDRQRDEVPEEHCDDNTLRTIRQSFTKAFDEDENPIPKTDSALVALYARVLKELKLSMEEWGRSGRSLRRWIDDRGEAGNRPRKCMGDRRRRGPQGTTLDPLAIQVLTAKSDRYWDNIRVTAKDIYADVRVALREINDARNAKMLAPIRVPGRTTVWRWLTSHSDYDKSRRRFGARIAERMFKPLKGSLEAKHILNVAIMDHTWADCHVIDDVHKVPVGRPYITMLIDVRSRYPLAHIIGYTPPSLETVMACIRRAVRPKTWINKQFPDIQGCWLAYGVPRTILVDNGWEFSGGSFKDACEDAGISVEWAPVRTPEYKGICERFFRTLNQLLIHKIKGSVPFSPQRLKEFGIDPSAEAVILLSELEELICHVIIEVYGREFHQGIKAVPEQVWRTDQAAVGIDYAADLQALDLSLGKMGPKRKLSKSGIQYKGLTYRSEAVAGLLNDLVPRGRKRGVPAGTVEVKFKYWPEDVSKIAVWSPVRQSYVELPCTNPIYAGNLSEHHHDVLREYAKDQGLKFATEDERCAARARLNEKISSFVTMRKIGDRRRAQRLLDEKRYVVDDEPDEIATEECVNPIETVANRVDGNQPARGSVRSTRRTKKRPPRAPGKTRDEKGADAVDQRPSHATLDPFAHFDRENLVSALEQGKEP
jgi:putative transposase